MKQCTSLATLVIALAPAALGQFGAIQEASAKFTHPSLDAGDRLGESVAIDGDWAIAGAQVATPVGGPPGAGRAFFYRRTPQGWAMVHSVHASDGEGAARFGTSVCIQGDTAVVGAITTGAQFGTGKAYVFERTGDQWTETQVLIPSDGQSGDRFGISVALSGNFLVVGAYLVDDVFLEAGAAYVFVRTPQGWVEHTKLLPPPASATPGIEWGLSGFSVAIEGGTVVMGTRDNHGAVFVYRRDSTGWPPIDILTDPGQQTDEEWFGSSVAIDGGTIVVGESNRPGAWAPQSGSVWVFEESSPGQWDATDDFRASDGSAQNYFGESVAIQGDVIAVGASGSDINGPTSGEGYLFTKQPGGWVETARLFGDPSTIDAQLGSSIAIDGPYVFAGAESDRQPLYPTGAVYVFEIELGDDTCTGLPNSTGETGQLAVIGSDTASDGLLTLSAYKCPRNSFGVFIVGDTRVPIPLGEGNLCIGGALARLPVALTGSGGAAMYDIEFAHPAVATRLISGATWSFQFYYRDTAGGPVGVNLTNAVELTLQ
jgi:hypothetical protein